MWSRSRARADNFAPSLGRRPLSEIAWMLVFSGSLPPFVQPPSVNEGCSHPGRCVCVKRCGAGRGRAAPPAFSGSLSHPPVDGCRIASFLNRGCCDGVFLPRSFLPNDRCCPLLDDCAAPTDAAAAE